MVIYQKVHDKEYSSELRMIIARTRERDQDYHDFVEGIKSEKVNVSNRDVCSD